MNPDVELKTLDALTGGEEAGAYDPPRNTLTVTLVMLPQARVQADVLRNELLTDKGLFAAADPTAVSPSPVTPPGFSQLCRGVPHETPYQLTIRPTFLFLSRFQFLKSA